MKWMMTCKQATEISNKLLDKEKVSLSERMQFMMHLAMCHLCSKYNTQYPGLHTLISNFEHRLLNFKT